MTGDRPRRTTWRRALVVLAVEAAVAVAATALAAWFVASLTHG